ncbi:SecY-interacting protein [Pantoea sp. 1.19]|uniref:SecY-interacting protein n=1 Tax=Pantoea sp. 1.19 TaxID=1925589 RepID=UPI0009489A30|nr:SecY-interacting protein [Pantoea sp. 1.19]
MTGHTADALRDFTRRYLESWEQQRGHGPESEALYGVPSPCIVSSGDAVVRWRPQPFTLAKNLDAVGRALEIRINEQVVALYTSQFAGDMDAEFMGRPIALLQTWSEADFTRVQENLIGHLVMQRRLKQTPTLFVATTASELEIIAVDNLTGAVVLEKLGTSIRQPLAGDLPQFLAALRPAI